MTGVNERSQRNLYPSYFKLHVRWLRSFTPVTYLCKLLEIHSLAAFLQLELFRVYQKINLDVHRPACIKNKETAIRKIVVKVAISELD